MKFRTKIDDSANDGTAIGPSSGNFKTYATLATAGTPNVSAITSSSASVSCVFNAQVVESTFSVVLQYRRFGDIPWTTFAVVTSGSSISGPITGLTGGTIYQVRLLGERTTENDFTWTSDTVSFTTVNDTPTVSTAAASSVAHNTAVINALVDPNTVTGEVFWGYGTVDGGAVSGNWQNITPLQAFSGDGEQSFGVTITGLTQNTPYFFRAFIRYPFPSFPNSTSGATLSFTTAIDPQVVAPLEEHMHIYNYDGHYGVQADHLYFTLQSPSGTSSDRLVTTAPGSLFAAGDIKISKDGGAFANVTNSVTQVAASNPLYKLVLTATEMQAEQIVIQIVDQNGPAFRDALILVRTKQRLGQFFVRADQIGSSASAIIGQPSTGGYGLDILDSAGTGVGTVRGLIEGLVLRSGTLQAGGASTATLDSGASSTNSYYNGDILMLLSNTGAGQSRVITGYDGTTKVATLNAAWSQNPDNTSRFAIVSGARALEIAQAELASIPSAGGNLNLKLQFIFQRFGFKVDQTATTQRLFKADSSTVLGTRSVSDDGTTQQIAKVT